jgi:hypothetical protein
VARIAAAAAGTLAASGLVLAPASTASATVTDLVSTVTPQIAGTGGLTSTQGYLCSVTGSAGVVQPCTSFDLGLQGLTRTELVPVEPSGWQFSGWTDCPDVVGDTCVLDTSLLGGLLGSALSPIAEFVPLPVGGEPGTPPDTRITATPRVDADGATTSTEALFTFTAVGDVAEPAFACRLQGPSHAHAFTACGTAGGTTGTKEYTDLEPGDYTFSVRALDGDAADPTPATFSWTVRPSGVPDTWLRGGPRNNGWLRAEYVSFRLASDAVGATYRCTLDGKARRCGGRLRVLHVAAGTHTVTAAATVADRTDRTPARRTFTRPVNDRDLRHGKAWRERGGKGYFLGTYSQTRTKGATLTKRARHITKVALVASKGRGFGTVKIYLGRQLLKKVSLRARTLHKRRIIPVERFRTPRRGLLRVVVVSRHKVVRIEGLGIARR